MTVDQHKCHARAGASPRRAFPRRPSVPDRAPASEVGRWAIRLYLLFALVFSAATALAADAASPGALTVGPGAEVSVDASDKPMVNKSTGLKGTVTLDQLGQPPSIHRLMYKGPADAKTEVSETIRYEKDGKVLEKPVRVTPSVAAVSPAAAPPPEGPYAAAFKILLQLFLVAVLLEQALSVIFNWRPFLQNFDARGVKTVVSVVVAWFVVTAFKMDFVKDLVNVYAPAGIASDLSSQLLTAMILAGGSAGVNNLLIALGFRSMRSAEAVAPKPPKKEAWIAVRLIRDKAVGSVTASIGTEGDKPAVAGIIERHLRKEPTACGTSWLTADASRRSAAMRSIGRTENPTSCNSMGVMRSASRWRPSNGGRTRSRPPRSLTSSCAYRAWRDDRSRRRAAAPHAEHCRPVSAALVRDWVVGQRLRLPLSYRSLQHREPTPRRQGSL